MVWVAFCACGCAVFVSTCWLSFAKSTEWQLVFIYYFIFHLFVEILVYQTLCAVIFHIGLPLYEYNDITAAHYVLDQCIHYCSEQWEFRKIILDMPSFFFVSRGVVDNLPPLVECALIKSYFTPYNSRGELEWLRGPKSYSCHYVNIRHMWVKSVENFIAKVSYPVLKCAFYLTFSTLMMWVIVFRTRMFSLLFFSSIFMCCGIFTTCIVLFRVRLSCSYWVKAENYLVDKLSRCFVLINKQLRQYLSSVVAPSNEEDDIGRMSSDVESNRVVDVSSRRQSWRIEDFESHRTVVSDKNDFGIGDNDPQILRIENELNERSGLEDNYESSDFEQSAGDMSSPVENTISETKFPDYWKITQQLAEEKSDSGGDKIDPNKPSPYIVAANALMRQNALAAKAKNQKVAVEKLEISDDDDDDMDYDDDSNFEDFRALTMKYANPDNLKKMIFNDDYGSSNDHESNDDGSSNVDHESNDFYVDYELSSEKEEAESVDDISVQHDFSENDDHEYNITNSTRISSSRNTRKGSGGSSLTNSGLKTLRHRALLNSTFSMGDSDDEGSCHSLDVRIPCSTTGRRNFEQNKGFLLNFKQNDE